MNLHEIRIPLTTKIVTVASALTVLLGVSTVTITLLLARSNTDATITEMSKVGLKVLQNDMNLEVADAVEEAEYVADSTTLAEAILKEDIKAIASLSQESFEEDNHYLVITSPDNKILYNTDSQYISAYSGEHSDISNVGSKLTAQATVPLEYKGEQIAWITYIIDLADPDIVESIKRQVDAEITLFLGDTRYNTTIFTNDGLRDTDSKASDKVITQVLQNGREFASQVKISDSNYYAEYMPLYDSNNEIIGMYFAGFPSASTDAMFINIIILAVVIGAVLVGITGATLLFCTKRILKKPLQATSTVVKDLRKGSLSAPYSNFEFYNDELGDFSKELTEAKHILSDYVDDIKSSAICMADGDFSRYSNLDYVGDFKQIKESFFNLNANMKNLITNVTASAEQVAQGAAQMADGTQSLADGTTKQATAVEQLTSTIVEISKQIDITAQNAQEANSLAGQTTEKMNQQDEAMRSMLEAMQIIEKQTEDIAGVITTIEDIAFQTNILALNASIEAARAGEAGKGFAVVADEVRNLAAKSAKSANQTNELITEAVNAVKQGSSLAARTSEVMEAVKEISNKTIVLVSQISDAANQQAAAVDQVTVGIEQISQVTTQNSATAEESAASCEELSSMAAELKTQISTLKA